MSEQDEPQESTKHLRALFDAGADSINGAAWDRTRRRNLFNAGQRNAIGFAGIRLVRRLNRESDHTIHRCCLTRTARQRRRLGRSVFGTEISRPRTTYIRD